MAGWKPTSSLLRYERLEEFAERVKKSQTIIADSLATRAAAQVTGGIPTPDTAPPSTPHLELEGLKLFIAFILHYDHYSGDLRPKEWPYDSDGKLLPPNKLDPHRKTHFYKGPCCFCAWLENREYTEAKIGLVTQVLATTIGFPEYAGKYAAICAKQKCGYFVDLDLIYAHGPVLGKMYYQRDKPLETHDPFLFITDDTEETIKQCGLRQVRILHDSQEDAPDNSMRGSHKLLQRQDPEYYTRLEGDLQRLLVAGLPAKAFWDVFVQCTKCNFVIPRHHFPYFHKCALKVAAPIVTDVHYGPSIAQELTPSPDPSPTNAESKRFGPVRCRYSDVDTESEGEEFDAEAATSGFAKNSSSLDTLVDELLDAKFEAARSSDDPPTTLFPTRH